jgi:hypothetical protein
MTGGALAVYLNDHLAGSVGAIEMIERVIRENEGQPIAAMLARELEVIKDEQGILRDLIERAGTRENAFKKAGAWLAEKAGRVKLGGTDETGELARMEMLEALALGIHGRRGMWRALREVVGKYPELYGLDLDRLERQATEQHDRVEQMRLEAAREAL